MVLSMKGSNMNYKITLAAIFVLIGSILLIVSGCRPVPRSPYIDNSVSWESLTTPHAAATTIINATGMAGINLGNTLDATPTEGSWTNGVVAQQYYFADYKAAGFNSVRIPITWNNHTSTQGPTYPINSGWMARVDTVVTWAINAGLVVTINCHHEDWLYADYENKKSRLDAIWQQIATHFKDISNSSLMFEIMNEPYDVDPANGIVITDDQVNDMNQRELNIIRASGGNNATRWVIIGPNKWNSYDKLPAMIPPKTGGVQDPYLIANFHDYNPWDFGGGKTQTWGTTGNLNNMAAELDFVKSWSVANSNIPIEMNEFGVIRKYTDSTGITYIKDPASRLLWYRTITQYSRDRGFSYFAWDDSGDFGIYSRAGRMFETGLLEALFGAP
jgi:endoglucanase